MTVKATINFIHLHSLFQFDWGFKGFERLIQGEPVAPCFDLHIGQVGLVCWPLPNCSRIVTAGLRASLRTNRLTMSSSRFYLI